MADSCGVQAACRSCAVTWFASDRSAAAVQALWRMQLRWSSLLVFCGLDQHDSALHLPTLAPWRVSVTRRHVVSWLVSAKWSRCSGLIQRATALGSLVLSAPMIVQYASYLVCLSKMTAAAAQQAGETAAPKQLTLYKQPCMASHDLLSAETRNCSCTSPTELWTSHVDSLTAVLMPLCSLMLDLHACCM